MKDKVAWNEITKNWTQQLNDFDKFQSYSKYLQINQQNILKYKEIDISIEMHYSIADIVISNNISGNRFKIRSLSHLIEIFKLNMETLENFKNIEVLEGNINECYFLMLQLENHPKT